MVDSINQAPRILAIDPFNKGFGYAVLEGPSRLVDWGIKSVRNGRNDTVLKRIETLINQNQPCVLIIEDVDHESCLRRERLTAQIRSICKRMEKNGCEVHRISRDRIVQTELRFGAPNKDAMAKVLVDHFPALEDWLPPPRKPWMSEDPRMSIFDSIAFVWTYVKG